MMIMPDEFQDARYLNLITVHNIFLSTLSPTQFLGGRRSQSLIIILNAVGIALTYYRSLTKTINLNRRDCFKN